MWSAPESELQILGDVVGLDAVELGCGTAYVSAWLARRGARPVGVDVTPAQLESARRCMRETGLEFPLVEADARGDRAAGRERRPRRTRSTAPRSGSTRTAGSPRPRGCCARAAGSSSCATRRCSILCSPDEGAADERLHPAAVRDCPARVARRAASSSPSATATWIALLRASGFEVERLVELQAPASAGDHRYYDSVTVEWASRWPAEEIWVARKR